MEVARALFTLKEINPKRKYIHTIHHFIKRILVINVGERAKPRAYKSVPRFARKPLYKIISYSTHGATTPFDTTCRSKSNTGHLTLGVHACYRYIRQYRRSVVYCADGCRAISSTSITLITANMFLQSDGVTPVDFLLFLIVCNSSCTAAAVYPVA